MGGALREFGFRLIGTLAPWKAEPALRFIKAF